MSIDITITNVIDDTIGTDVGIDSSSGVGVVDDVVSGVGAVVDGGVGVIDDVGAVVAVVDGGVGVVDVGISSSSEDTSIDFDINKIILLLRNYNFINDIITKKLALSIPEEQNNKLMSILEFIYTDKQSKLPLKSIIQQIKEIFDDNKLDIYDIPKIIEIVSNFFNLNIASINVQHVTIDDVALCIKVLLIIFIETKVVGNNMNIELPVILKLFDSSLNLLKLNLNIVKGTSCLKVFNCCK
jgi:hypothetical protein